MLQHGMDDIFDRPHIKDKKFKAVISDGREIHFGLKGSHTYIDGASKLTRDAYLKRHLGNKMKIT